MKATKLQVSPEEYVLAPLSSEERLEAALKIAREAFKGTSLSLVDIEAAVRKVRGKLHAQRQKKVKGRR
jgi:hypothetical protein